MDILSTTSYDNFRCLAGSCPETCCRGWKVLVDEETLSFFRSRKLPERILLTLPVTDKKTDPVLDITAHRCFFHTREGLCTLQKHYGEKHMPKVCRTYPRERINYGTLGFRSLDLACYEAARMFLSEGAPRWELKDDDIGIPVGTTNDDPLYLTALAGKTAEIADEAGAIRDAEELKRFFARVTNGAMRWQASAIKGGDPFEDDRISQDLDEVTEDDLLPLPMNEINLLVNTCLYHDDVRRRSPVLYRLCKRYFKRFDRLTAEGGRPVLKELFKEELKARPDGALKYGRYFAMETLRFFPEVYEDYSFYRKVRLNIMHVNLVLLFDALTREANGGILTTDEEAHILAVYEKRAFHSPGLLNKMYRIIDNYENQDQKENET